jgi:hypothetical protein
LGALCRKQETIDPVDDEYARRDCVCRELERIDELRYRLEDQWGVFQASKKQSEERADRKRKRKSKRNPGALTEVMRNAKTHPGTRHA